MIKVTTIHEKNELHDLYLHFGPTGNDFDNTMPGVRKGIMSRTFQTGKGDAHCRGRIHSQCSSSRGHPAYPCGLRGTSSGSIWPAPLCFASTTLHRRPLLALKT